MNSKRAEALGAAALLFAAIVGAAGAVAAIPTIFRTLPNSLDRVRVIIHVLRSNQPRIVVVGDSRAAASVDGRQLRGELPDHPLVLNLACQGQGLSEALFLLEEMPRSVQTVVLAVSRERLMNESAFNAIWLDALVMYGASPSQRARQMVASAAGVNATRDLKRSAVSRRVGARWGIQQAPDMMAYALVRGNAWRSLERDDIYFPSIYGVPQEAERLETLLSAVTREMALTSVTISRENRMTIDAIARMAAARSIRLLIVLVPVHPRLAAAAPARFLAPPDFQGVEVLDATTSLAADDFADPLHVTYRGARTVTSLIARRLASR